MWTKHQASAALLAVMLPIVGCAQSEPPSGTDVAAIEPSSGPDGAALAATLPATPAKAGAAVTSASQTEAGATHAPTSGLVKGVVRDASGAPVASAAVAVTAGTGPYPEMAAYTAADGSYQWMLGPGTYTLEAQRDGFAPASSDVTLEAGEQVELDLTLTPE